MGMYTEFGLVTKVRGDAPAEVIEMLKVMCTGGANEVDLSHLNHPFFSCSRAPWMFQSNSYYHTPASVSQFVKDDIGNFWTLIIRCDLKNYENEINHFVDWVTPYLDVYENEHLGWQKYEEDTIPTLLFHPNRWLTPDFPELEE